MCDLVTQPLALTEYSTRGFSTRQGQRLCTFGHHVMHTVLVGWNVEKYEATN